MWAIWWIWVAGGFALGIVELLLPGFIFAGFAIGAVALGILLGLNVPGSSWIIASPFNALLLFAVVSGVAWLVIRRVLGVRKGQVKIWRTDINDD
jgi:membrane protein implicated in regulation of membrane protease activity